MQPSAQTSHNERVHHQFGPVAAAYLTSTPHAQGPDLQRMSERFREHPEARVLDLGCGAGHLSFAIAPQVQEVVALDLSPEMLETVRDEAHRRGLRNVRTERAAVEALPFAGQSFDVVCTRFSAHHWAELRQALKEVRRVLRPDGRLVLIDIVGHADALLDTRLQAVELLRDTSHVRDHSVAEWQVLLLEAGFRPEHPVRWKLPIDFGAWVARMRTPPARVEVIRELLRQAPEAFKRHYALADDLSFELDAAMFEAVPM